MTKGKKDITLTLEDILDNGVTKLSIKGLKKSVVVRDPSIRERLQARKEASELPGWDSMDRLERSAEINKLVAVKMLVDPEVSLEDYLNSSDILMFVIIDEVSLYYVTKLNKLTAKRSRDIEAFLEPKTDA